MSTAAPASLQTVMMDMKQGRFEQALAAAESLIAAQPADTNALYMAAVCSRQMKDFERAEFYLNRLKHTLPDFGRAYEEEGHLRLAQQDLARARRAFEMATVRNPALLGSWAKLSEVAGKMGDEAAAREAAGQAARLQNMPRELRAVTQHIHEGQVQRAEQIVREYLKTHPQDVEALRLLADIASRQSVLDDAQIFLQRALNISPETSQLRIDLIQVYRKSNDFAKAYEQAQILHDKDPSNPVFQSLLAVQCMHAGKIERSIELFDRVLEVRPDNPDVLTTRGHALKTFGKGKEAVASYKASVAADPLFGDAWFGLANLKTYRFTQEDVAAMRAALEHPDISYESRVNIEFALASALEKAEDYEQAFGRFRDGNLMRARQSSYSTEQLAEEFAAQKAYFTRERFEERRGTGDFAMDPIFIVGLPRAGSTLLEQILASHSQVDGTQELPNIPLIVRGLTLRAHQTGSEPYPQILSQLSNDELRQLGVTYIEGTRSQRRGAPLFIDKMPNNFRHIGLIHMILPNAKIIDARRNPLDCCWSGYKQLFARGQEFTYGLDRIGHYYRHYVDLMKHWDEVLPEGRVLKVQHEDVLDDLEGQVRRMLDYCNLPFEEACVRFHETDRPVHTASAEQVRQPINRSGVEQWRPYEAHLDPLKQALGPSLTDY